VFPALCLLPGFRRTRFLHSSRPLPLGATALAKTPGVTSEIIAAGGEAFQQAYVVGLRTTALSSLSFGVLAIIACCFCNDIGPKMNNKI